MFRRKRKEKEFKDISTAISREGVDPSLMLEAVRDDAKYMVVMTKDPGRIYHWVSPSCERFVGWTPDEIIGKSSDDFVIELSKPAVNEAIEFVESNNASARLYVGFKHKDGRTIIIECTIWATPSYGRVTVCQFPNKKDLL